MFPHQDWFAPHVEELASWQITVGYGDGTYRPHRGVTRAEMAMFLARAFNLPVTDPSGIFSDVNPGAYYAGAAEAPVQRRDHPGMQAHVRAES